MFFEYNRNDNFRLIGDTILSQEYLHGIVIDSFTVPRSKGTEDPRAQLAYFTHFLANVSLV